MQELNQQQIVENKGLMLITTEQYVLEADGVYNTLNGQWEQAIGKIARNEGSGLARKTLEEAVMMAVAEGLDRQPPRNFGPVVTDLPALPSPYPKDVAAYIRGKSRFNGMTAAVFGDFIYNTGIPGLTYMYATALQRLVLGEDATPELLLKSLLAMALYFDALRYKADYPRIDAGLIATLKEQGRLFGPSEALLGRKTVLPIASVDILDNGDQVPANKD